MDERAEAAEQIHADLAGRLIERRGDPDQVAAPVARRHGGDRRHRDAAATEATPAVEVRSTWRPVGRRWSQTAARAVRT